MRVLLRAFGRLHSEMSVKTREPDIVITFMMNGHPHRAIFVWSHEHTKGGMPIYNLKEIL